jgi:hypothetical protein
MAEPTRLNITLDLMIGWDHPSYWEPVDGEWGAIEVVSREPIVRIIGG